MGALRHLLVCATAIGGALAHVGCAAADSAHEQHGVIAQVIVTAERRPVEIQSVPLSVTALTADDIGSLALRGAMDLTNAVPGLQFGQQGIGANAFIRGVGATSGAIGNEAPVSTYIDGVYVASPTASVFTLAGTRQIEVLKGPQGTLFGRNATAGVIQIETRDPELDPSAELQLQLANDADTRASVYATAGMSESLAANLSLHYRDQHDGWGTNLATGEPTFRHEESGARAKLEWRPGSSTRLMFGASHAALQGEDGLGYHLLPGSLGLDGRTGYSGFYNAWANPQDRAKYRHDVLSARLEQQLRAFRLVNILSWQQLHAFFRLDQDATPAPIIDAPISQYGHTVTEELQFLSHADASWPWIVGVYYFNDRSAYDPLIIAGAAVQPLASTEVRSKQQSESYAIYGQTTIPLAPRTALTLGARYTRDDRRVAGTTMGTLDDNTVPLTSAQQNDRWEQPTWRVALSRELRPEVMAYLSWDRGFKSGVYNLLNYAAPAVNPEEVDAYQAGVKSDWLQHRLRVNVAGFFYQHRNIQVEVIDTGAVITTNAAAARMRGVELETEYLPSTALSLRAAVSLLDGKYTDFENALIATPNRDGEGNLIGGNTVTSGDATGRPGIRSPRTSLLLETRYRVPTQRGEFGFNVAYAYTSRFAWDPDGRVQESAHGMLSASLDWTSPRQLLTVHLAGSNLTNSERCVQAFASGVGDVCSPAAPRMLSIGISTRL
jgi:iron complex outermembrane receptor protein